MLPGMMPVIAGSRWRPSRLGSLALWLDGADAGTVTTAGGSVSSWADKSGNGRTVTQGTGTAQPTHNSSTGYLSFDGGDSLSVTSNVFGTGSPAYTWAFVMRTGADTSARILASYGNANNNNQLNVYGTGSSQHTNYWWFNDLAGPASSTSTNYIGYVRFSGSAGANSHEIWINGPASVSASRNASGLNLQTGHTFHVGKRWDNYFWNGLIGEMIIVNADVGSGTDDHRRIEGYLAHKWGLASLLDAGHPYKNFAP